MPDHCCALNAKVHAASAGLATTRASACRMCWRTARQSAPPGSTAPGGSRSAVETTKCRSEAARGAALAQSRGVKSPGV